MAEYRRFVAYFYEYIDGKRQRNAGFVKAQRQGEIWKLQLQLKAGRWPEGQMPVYGYEGKEDSFPAFFLGMGYGKRDSFQASLEYRQEEAAEEEKRTENLQGMWIPLDSRRSYISHWLEGEIDPENCFCRNGSRSGAAGNAETRAGSGETGNAGPGIEATPSGNAGAGAGWQSV